MLVESIQFKVTKITYIQLKTISLPKKEGGYKKYIDSLTRSNAVNHLRSV